MDSILKFGENMKKLFIELGECPECKEKYNNYCLCLQTKFQCKNNHRWWRCRECDKVNVDDKKLGCPYKCFYCKDI